MFESSHRGHRCRSPTMVLLALVSSMLVACEPRETGTNLQANSINSNDTLSSQLLASLVANPNQQHKTTESATFDEIVFDQRTLYWPQPARNEHDQEHAHKRVRRTAKSEPERPEVVSSNSNKQFTSNLNIFSSQSNKVDACESKMEIITPYYATNSKGKIRTIVNSELMQQAIQVETCLNQHQNQLQQVTSVGNSNRWPSIQQQAAKCNGQPDCGCEQKYKWHRLLVMDPNQNQPQSQAKPSTSQSPVQGAPVQLVQRGPFMDWFLFPSSCVCRCKQQASVLNQSQRVQQSSLRHQQQQQQQQQQATVTSRS